MNILFQILLLSLVASCAKAPVSIKKPLVAKQKKKPIIKIKTAHFDIKIGTAKFIKFPLSSKVKLTGIHCQDIGKIEYQRDTDGLRFFLPVPYKFSKKLFDCSLNIKGQSKPIKFLQAKAVTVKYPVRKLNVAKKHVELSDKNVKRWLREKAKQEKIYSTPSNINQMTEGFSNPLTSKITSRFGYKRVFNNKKDSWHSGTDFRAPIGTKIPATNRGIVRFAGSLFFNGGTVILDHGMGIYTMYCHLSKVLVQEGELIPKGSIIAKSGNTGRSTGPHLHWGTKVNGHWVDSSSLINASGESFSD